MVSMDVYVNTIWVCISAYECCAQRTSSWDNSSHVLERQWSWTERKKEKNTRFYQCIGARYTHWSRIACWMTGWLAALCLPTCTTTHVRRSCYRNPCIQYVVDLNLSFFFITVTYMYYIALVDSVDLAQYLKQRVYSSWPYEMKRSALACAFVSLCCVCFSSGFDDVVVDNFVCWWFCCSHSFLYVCVCCVDHRCVGKLFKII